MATKKKTVQERGLVKIHQSSINKVKKEIIGTKLTIGDFYEVAVEEKLNKTKTN